MFHPTTSSLFELHAPGSDPLGVLTTTAPVAAGNRWAWLDAEAVRTFAKAHVSAPEPTQSEEALHCTFLPPERFCNYLLVLEALNFCFWDEPPRWQVHYNGATHDGYWALAAALRRAIEEDGLPLWDARFLATLDARRMPPSPALQW